MVGWSVALTPRLTVVIASAIFVSASQARDVWCSHTILFSPYVDDTLDGQGLAKTIFRAGLDQIGFEIQVELMPWNRALNAAKSDEVDGLISAWYATERAQQLVCAACTLS